MVVDVAGRYLLNRPLFGAVELSEFLLVILGFGSLALVEQNNRHINVDFFVAVLPKPVQSLFSNISAVLAIGFFALMGWRAFVQAERVRLAGEVSLNWQLPTHWFYWFVAASCFLCVLATVSRVALSDEDRK